MKKHSFIISIFTLMLFFALQTIISAQAADTLVVPSIIDGDPIGAINKTIHGDTTATGERNNPNRVYLLERSKVYFLDGPITSTDYHLHIVGQEPTETERPAVIMPAVLGDGSIAVPMLLINSDFTLRNIYFMCAAQNGATVGWDMAVINNDGIRAVIDGCIFEANTGIIFDFLGAGVKVFATDNIFRNNLTTDSWWNGGRAIWIEDAYADSIVIVNNTWANSGSYLYTDRDRGTNYLKIEHNTLVNASGFPFFLHNMTDASISNNIFYNCTFGGEAEWHEFIGGWNDMDGMPASIVSVDTLGGANFKLDSLFWQGDAGEAKRMIDVNNNSYYWQQEIKDEWAKIDSIVPAEWMNTRTIAMFGNDDSWPGLNESNNVNVDPAFAVVPTVIDSIAKFIQNTKYWANGADFRYPAGKTIYLPEWPIPEDLSYTNAALQTAADGFPVGDLNWFPERKEDWITDVEINTQTNVPSEFNLSQNYPNPFNPTTTIQFGIPKASQVKLTIYNIIGQVVAELVNGNMKAGYHEVHFNASNISSGVYFYRISAGDFMNVKKMVLLK